MGGHTNEDGKTLETGAKSMIRAAKPITPVTLVTLVTLGPVPLHARAPDNRKSSVTSVTSVTLCPSTLTSLADRITRLRPDHRDPEQFHVEKHSIAGSLRRLAKGKTP